MDDRIDRRDFMKRMAAGTFLIATSQLPAPAEDDPQVFQIRGESERLSLAYATINIGLEKPFSILHISDTHLTAAYPHEDEKKQQLCKNRTQCFGGRQEEALRDSLEWAKEHVDYIIHTGDLIDWQSEANFDLVRKYFGENITGAIGNHEYSTDMWLSEPKEEHTEAYKNRTRQKISAAYPFDTTFQAQTVNDVNFITIDDVYGYVTPYQVESFHKEVKKGLPIVLCMHVPFLSENIWRATVRFWYKRLASDIHDDAYKLNSEYKVQTEDPTTRSFIEYLKKEPLLKAILAGHEHITVQEQFSPTARQYVVGGNFLFHGEEIIFV
jgi:predicted phosphodiesterase